jgi:hypothetical protein
MRKDVKFVGVPPGDNLLTAMQSPASCIVNMGLKWTVMAAMYVNASRSLLIVLT